MAVHLFGNIDGRSYQAPDINLFELAGKQSNQPVKVSDTKIDQSSTALKVSISKEGLRALHGSKLKGSVDLEGLQADIEFSSKHQPIESFTNRFSRAVANGYLQSAENASNEDATIQEKGNALSKTFKDICDEIISGYDQGSRIRFMENSDSEDGFIQLSREDELSILLSEFEEFVEARFGKQHQKDSERWAEIVNDVQNTKQELGYADVQYYEPEQIPNDFVENLLNEAKAYVDMFAK